MGSQLVRKSSYLVIAVLLVALSVALVANFNVQTAQAGGSPQPLYTLISTEMTANATFTIYTTTSINGLNSYVVKSNTSATNWYISWLGTDFLCIKNGASVGKVPLCLPYSSIAGIKYQ